MASEMDLQKKGTNSKFIRPILKFASEYPKKVIIQLRNDVVQCQDFHDAQCGPQGRQQLHQVFNVSCLLP